MKSAQYAGLIDVASETERELWLQLLEGSFKLIYKDPSAEGLPPARAALLD
jgi:hypothetical protein